MEQMRSAVLDFASRQAWAITAYMFNTVFDVLHKRIYEGGVNIAEVEASLGVKLQNSYEIKTVKKVQVIPIHGTIAKRMNLFSAILGGVSTELVKRDIAAAIDNPDIDAIVLDIDSPGGTVDGTGELADFIFESRGKKPIVAHGNGLMASAAYWIGSAADKITAYDTAEIGSIGIFMRHVEFSEMDKKDGVKTTYVYAGKYKVMGNDTEPLKADAKEYFQKQVDDLYKIFVDGVARNRNVSAEQVLKDMADGKIVLGIEAKELGLIDKLMTLEETIEMAAAMADGTYDENNTVKEDEDMDVNTVKEKHPDVYAAIIAAGKAEGAKGGEMEQGIKDMETKILGLETKIVALTDENARLVEKNKELDKELSTSKAKAQAEKESAQAEAIMNEILKTSTVTESLYGKVRVMLSYGDFRKEDGVFDAEAFTAAFKAEVSDWEDKVKPSGNLGLGGEGKKEDLGKGSLEARKEQWKSDLGYK